MKTIVLAIIFTIIATILSYWVGTTFGIVAQLIFIVPVFLTGIIVGVCGYRLDRD